MGKFIRQKYFSTHIKYINEGSNYSLTSNNPLSKSARFYDSFYNVVNVPRNPSVKRSKPIVPWKPSQGSIAQWKAKLTSGTVAKDLKSNDSPDNIPQKDVNHASGAVFIAPGSANTSTESDVVLFKEAKEYDETKQLIKNEIYQLSGIKASEFQPLPDHRNAGYTDDLTNYIRNTLIPKVNQRGKAPLWLRPLAAIAAWFGYHGLGQTNCLSCAASVADTLKQRVLHQAFPRLRGGKPSMFSTLQQAPDTGGVRALDSIEDLAAFLNNSRDNLNIVLTINRPRSFWQRLFSSVDGHACNIIKTDGYLHLVDAQKRRYNLVHLTSANGVSKDLITVFHKFIGAVSPEERSLMLYLVGW